MFFLYTGNVTDASNNQLILGNAVGTNSGNPFSEPLGTVTLADLRCAILPSVIILIIVGVSFIATKIYSGQVSLEVIALFAFIVFLLSVCFVFFACVRRHCSRGRAEQSARAIREDHLAALASTAPGISETVARATLTAVPTTAVRPSAPPPPYHIAILMPPDEAPPPSYDKVMR